MSNNITTPLIVSADDYAQSASIDHGILKLIQLGRLTATSCLTLSPRWHEAASAITGDIRQQADIGLHLDFTQFSAPICRPHPQLVLHSLLRKLNPVEIRTTIARQLDAFEQALGNAPDYIDGHQHVHQLPQIRTALLAELQLRYPGELPWIRVSQPRYGGIKGRVITALGSNELRTQAHMLGFATTDTLLGVYAFDSDATHYGRKLRHWLAMAVQQHRQGSLCALMCHPGLPDHGTDDAISQARPVEYAVLSSPEFIDTLKTLGIILVKGSRILPRFQ